MSSGILSDPHRRHLALTVAVGAGLAAYLLGAVQTVYGFNFALLLALLGGYPIFSAAVTGLLSRRISADLAVALAAVAALAIGQYAVAAEVVFIMLVGEALENFAVGRTRSAIGKLLALRPDVVRVRRGEAELLVGPGDVRGDDVVLVRPGERIGVDGKVLAGSSSVDQGPITGESIPADKAPGDEVFAGTINLYGALEIAVERLGEDTTLERIIHLVEQAEEARAPTQRLADRYATWFVPVVLLIAGATWLITRDVTRSVAVLVVACPCALVLATPTAIAAGVGRLVRRGVLVKGGAVLERLGRLRAVVFDKTGTLTEARLRVAEVVPAPGRDPADVLRLGAAVERHSEHPIGQLIVARAAEAGIELPPAIGFTAHPGMGASATLGGFTARVGNARFLEEAGVAVPAELAAGAGRLRQAGCTVVLVAAGDSAVGAVAIEDTPRPGAREAIDRLRELGVERIAMLTGDNAAAAASVARHLGIEDVRSELLPGDKVSAVRAIQRDFEPVAMVGDGINDAPSLVSADVGVAMAEIGTDVAIDSAGLVLLGDRLGGLPDAVAVGRQALRIIWQNILGFALGFNALAVVAAASGFISPVVAAVLHQVSSLVVCLNSLRLLVDFAAAKQRVLTPFRAVRRRWRLAVGAAAAAAACAWLLSGVHTVRIGQAGVAQRFGKVVRPAEGPGLHYRLPWPFGRHRIVDVAGIRRCEVGFRTMPGRFAEPPAYEWNLQHRGGRNERRPEEAVVWAGDEQLVDVNLVVHYRVADPVAAVLTLGATLPDGADKWDALIRGLAEAAVRAEMSRRTTDAVLSADRREVEGVLTARVVRTLAPRGTGLTVLAVRLADVHPPLEVVPDFRDVASALEEKEARINQAHAYRNQVEALARGNAEQRKLAAQAYLQDRTLRAHGRADRFTAVAQAAAEAPELTRLRLYLETVEQVLAGRRKVILDRAPHGARRLLMLGGKALWGLMPPAPGKEPPPPSPEEMER